MYRHSVFSEIDPHHDYSITKYRIREGTVDVKYVVIVSHLKV